MQFPFKATSETFSVLVVVISILWLLPQSMNNFLLMLNFQMAAMRYTFAHRSVCDIFNAFEILVGWKIMQSMNFRLHPLAKKRKIEERKRIKKWRKKKRSTKLHSDWENAIEKSQLAGGWIDILTWVLLKNEEKTVDNNRVNLKTFSFECATNVP